MLKKLSHVFATALGLILLSPAFIYWWGLSLLQTEPAPSVLSLTEEQKKQIWIREFEVGKPQISPVSPYGYINYVYCVTNNDLISPKCAKQYPGLRLSALAVKPQVAEQVRGKGNTAWQIAWASYTIWVTRHWNIDQVLATYHESYNT